VPIKIKTKTMKLPFLILSLTIYSDCYAQTDYYSTNGKNRLTKIELDVKISESKAKFEKIMQKEMFVGIKTKSKEVKQDSIIHFVSFDIKDSNTAQGPMPNLINNELPEMTMTDSNGKEIALISLNGKPTLINFWYAACAPCIDEMPVLNKIYEKYKEEYNFIAVTYEPKEKVDLFLKKHPYNFFHIVDAKEFTDKLEIKTYPLNLFLDKNGIVKYAENGIPYTLNVNGESNIGAGKEFVEKLEKLK
jgi:thiol-disulfide isomerase/thioredoxin